MRSHTRLLALSLCALCGAQARVVQHFHILGDEGGGWPAILGSIGLTPGAPDVTVVRQGEQAPAAPWTERIRQGGFVILEGESELAQTLGFRPGNRQVSVRSVAADDGKGPAVIWEKALDVRAFETPPEARVFARERWQGIPLVAGFRLGEGAVLWVATQPGEQGYERYPYLLQALAELGLEAPLRSSRLWAFFDSAYRSRVDVEYFAERWRKAGIGALHVAAWQHFEADEECDAYLRRLIEACHRRAILVYAWLELPHVSEKFWNDHPEWREKTALGQDAHLDWRKLMNLADPDCHREAARGVRSLLERFDWDGVNLAELYFESLEGASNLARFTPFNATVVAEFRKIHQAAPLDALPQFLAFRAELTHRLQREWLGELEAVRRGKPHLDIALTHIDDRFDTNMRDALGADAARALPLAVERGATFLIEDPATVWHLGPQRYASIREKYAPLTSRPEKLAIDLNIVERYQDVYPTKQQTGTELFQLVHQAAKSFPRVALYFENSILRQDTALLPSAAAHATRLERIDSRVVVESPHGVGVRWNGPARVDGKPWPAGDGAMVWLTPGAHVIDAAAQAPQLRMLDFNGTLRSAAATAKGIEFSYESASRAIAVFDKRPAKVDVDEEPGDTRVLENDGRFTLLLPAGQHLVRAGN